MRLPKPIDVKLQRIERADGRGGQQVGPVAYHHLRDAIANELTLLRLRIEANHIEIERVTGVAEDHAFHLAGLKEALAAAKYNTVCGNCGRNVVCECYRGY